MRRSPTTCRGASLILTDMPGGVWTWTHDATDGHGTARSLSRAHTHIHGTGVTTDVIAIRNTIADLRQRLNAIPRIDIHNGGDIMDQHRADQSAPR